MNLDSTNRLGPVALFIEIIRIWLGSIFSRNLLFEQLNGAVEWSVGAKSNTITRNKAMPEIL